MANHIFFHDDLDGIVSTAMYMLYSKEWPSRLHPVSSTMRGKKFSHFFNAAKGQGGTNVILDYEHCAGVDVWIDHHYDQSFGDNPINTKSITYDHRARSAVALVAKRFACEEAHKELVSDLETIDSCGYENVDMIFTDTSPIMNIRSYLEIGCPSEMAICRIAEVMCNLKLDVYSSAYLMKINSYYTKELKKNAVKIKNDMLVAGGVSIVNQKNSNKFPRYSEFLVNPEVRYSIRTTNIGNGNVRISVGSNQWHDQKNDTNIGSLFLSNKHGLEITQWGGHFGVAGGIVKESGMPEFLDVISTILNKEDGMEKYAVDVSDPVEKKAVEFVKTGEVKSISEGRSMAANLEEGVEKTDECKQ